MLRCYPLYHVQVSNNTSHLTPVTKYLYHILLSPYAYLWIRLVTPHHCQTTLSHLTPLNLYSCHCILPYVIIRYHKLSSPSIEYVQIYCFVVSSPLINELLP